MTVMDMVSSGKDLEEDACRRLDRDKLERTVWVAVDQLPGNQPAVLRMIYKEQMNSRAAGQLLGVNGSKVRNIKAKALSTLRQSKKYPQLHCYYETYLSACSYHHVSVVNFRRTWTSEVEREAIE